MRDRYAVIGQPIAHSRSPQIHTAFALQTVQNLEYGRLLGEPGQFAAQVRAFFAEGGRGLNVTLPFKEDAWRLAEVLTPAAANAHAVNTLMSLPDGRLLGDNTDGSGLLRDLSCNHGLSLHGRRILLLGAGGASRGVLRPLLEAAPAALFIANRTPEKAVALAQQATLWGPVQGGGLAALSGQTFDLIINATSAGLAAQPVILPAPCLAPGGAVYDLLYAAQPTAFLRWGLAQSAELAVDGLGMLVEQAADAFQRWRGVRPATQALIAQLRGSLA